MSIRSIAFLAAVVAFGAAHSLGDEFFRADCEADPNHLVPMHSFMEAKRGFLGNYDELLVKHLFVTDSDLARMLVRPSFSSEFCMSVDVEPAEASGPQEATSGGQKDEARYRITVTTAVPSIWGALRKAEKRGEPFHVEIERVDRQISRDLAVAIQRVWAKTLLLTRHPAATELHTGELESYTGHSDGTTYQFSAGIDGVGTREGQTWSPKQGLPLELTNIGVDLVAFARQDAKGKDMTEEQLIERLKKLESTIPQQ